MRWTITCLSPPIWREAIKNVSPKRILPVELGGYRGQKMKAWLGDLVLNAAVARELMKKRSERQNVVTNHNVAVSNEFLYNRANSILNLPKHITDDEKYRKLSEHQIGTIVEAAVAEVNEIDETAVKDLANYLVDIVKTVPKDRINAKAKFKQLGGHVDSYMKSRDGETTLFESTASIRNRTAKGVARTKVKAEKLAIESLLTKIGVVDSIIDPVEEEEE